MKKLTLLFFVIMFALTLTACELVETQETQESKDAVAVQRQQSQYAAGQPVPAYNWSLERDLLIKLYNIRNQKVVTHSVWRSDYGVVEGACPSFGYGIPYDTSLTNPLVATDLSQSGNQHTYQGGALASIEQPEPNGVFASKNTNATWVMCLGEGGNIEPVYTEAKVTVYPGPVIVDYEKNTVTRSGAATVIIAK